MTVTIAIIVSVITLSFLFRYVWLKLSECLIFILTGEQYVCVEK